MKTIVSNPAQPALFAKVSDQVFVQIVRISSFAFLITFTIIQYLLNPDFIHWELSRNLYLFSALGLGSNLLIFVFSDYVYKKEKLLLLSFIFDSLLLLSLLFLVALNSSIFLLLFIIHILTVGLVFGQSYAVTAASLVSLAFCIQYALLSDPRTASSLFLLVLSFSAFFIVAVFSGQIHSQLSFFIKKIDAQSLNLSSVQRLNEILIESMPVGILTLNANLEIINYNPFVSSIFSEIPNLNSIKGRDLNQIMPSLPFQALQVQGVVEFIHEGKNIRANMFRPFKEIGFLALEDLTELKKLERNLRQSEKLAAVGQLAAGIAHEIRNPLASISGSVELLNQNFASADDQKLGRIILKEISRLNRLITEFLDYAKPDQEPIDRVSLKHLLEEVVTAFQAQAGTTYEVKCSLVEGEIAADSDKLKQAFLNILMNAQQAMESVTKKQILVEMKRNSGVLEVSFRDTGSGIDPKIMERIFEPFFTTKSKGTGLGLALTHKIIQSHQGSINVESKPGLGTVFKFTFPLKI